MTVPQVLVNELDGALGVLPTNLGLPLVVLGPADDGPYDVAAAFARDTDIRSNYVGGPLVESLCYWIKQYQRPGVAIRTHASTHGAYGTPVVTRTGTAIPSMDGTTHPNDDYELAVQCVLPPGVTGTIGSASPAITVRWTLDGGRTWSDSAPLGTANSYVVPGSGGSKVLWAAGTVVDGDTIAVRCAAPTFNSDDLTTALEALRVSAYRWQVAYPAGPIDATLFGTVELGFASMISMNKRRAWVGSARIRGESESRSSYQTAMAALSGAMSSLRASIYAGDAKISSGVTGRSYRRPAAFAACCRETFLQEHQNSAWINLGPLPGVQLADPNGNPDCHDEYLFPGLDDLRFATLRTWANRIGAFITDPRIICPVGSDFSILPYRRVMNVFEEVSQAYLEERLQHEIRVYATGQNAGFIYEPDAKEIESGWRAAIDGVLSSGPKISGRSCSVSRTDNVLSTKALSCDGSVVPLAYPRLINLTTRFVNPARAIVPV